MLLGMPMRAHRQFMRLLGELARRKMVAFVMGHGSGSVGVRGEIVKF
jgi:hypothetical protein